MLYLVNPVMAKLVFVRTHGNLPPRPAVALAIKRHAGPLLQNMRQGSTATATVYVLTLKHQPFGRARARHELPRGHLKLMASQQHALLL